MKVYIGCDVSKGKIDFSIKTNSGNKGFTINNNSKDLTKFITKMTLNESLHFVCEATGVYHHILITCLASQGIAYSVVNPKKIANHGKTIMRRAKTDSVDAKIITDYAYRYEPTADKLPNTKLLKIQSILKTIEDYYKELTALNNRYKAYSFSTFTDNIVLKSFERMIKYFETEIKLLENKAQNIITEVYPDELNRIRAIKGVGPRLAVTVLAFFGKFESFENSKQVIGFIGTDPSPHESGSFKGTRRISRQGNKHVRSMLYMASLSAARFNKNCKALRDRLKEKGKAHKQIMVAVSNKLIRQIFAVLKYERVWDENFGM